MNFIKVPHDFVSFFVCSIEKFIAWCFSTEKNYYNLTKNSHKLQASVTGMVCVRIRVRVLSVRVLEYFGKIL